ncbi:hypothetical protein J437_LFUL007441 [Ladona fulva]|uniref:Uncharacterized protein n=1 Tax=Ladona fulva TaxID=123851 RepID=A0A8K0P3F1_LADFU|nr:hypothetical protein J437_LFUL007441 [Ladona fulva]
MVALRHTFWILFFAAALLAGCPASPIFDVFGLGSLGNRRPSGGGGGQRTGRERWKKICRAHNADPYAFPGRVPYPSAPLCPY